MINWSLPNLTSLDTDPIALVTVHVYFPISLSDGNEIGK